MAFDHRPPAGFVPCRFEQGFRVRIVADDCRQILHRPLGQCAAATAEHGIEIDDVGHRRRLCLEPFGSVDVHQPLPAAHALRTIVLGPGDGVFQKRVDDWMPLGGADFTAESQQYGSVTAQAAGSVEHGLFRTPVQTQGPGEGGTASAGQATGNFLVVERSPQRTVRRGLRIPQTQAVFVDRKKNAPLGRGGEKGQFQAAAQRKSARPDPPGAGVG